MWRRSVVRLSSVHSELSDRGFRCHMPWKVAWRDMDVYGIVNNVVIVSYLEQTRADLLVKIGVDIAGKDDVGVIVAGLDCKFRRPMKFPDELVLASRVAACEPAKGSFTLEHVVHSSTLGGIAARGSSSCVVYDFSTNKRTAIPADWLEKMRGFGEVP